MAAPSENKESNTFSVSSNDCDIIQDEFLSPVYRISGYPWRLRIVARRRGCTNAFRPFSFALICDKSREAELWKCTATIKVTWSTDGGFTSLEHTFMSWDEKSHEKHLLNACCCSIPKEYKIQFHISTKENGNSWRLYPLNFGLDDCILVVGEKKEKIPVNKKSWASQSPFFDRLFNCDFKEKNMKEIPIGGVEGKEFCNIIKLLFRFDGACLSTQNVHRVMELTDRFKLKIVEDRVISYLLSSSSPLSIVDTFRIADQYNLHFLKDNLHMGCAKADIIELSNSTEFDLLPHYLLKFLFNKSNVDSMMSIGGLKLTPICVSGGWCIDDMKQTLSTPETTLSIVFKDWDEGQVEQFSSVYRINGFPWRLRINRTRDGCTLYLVCDKSNEAELWKCTATFVFVDPRIKLPERCMYTFASWDKSSHEYPICCDVKISAGYVLQVSISTNDDGESYFRRRPLHDSSEPRDGILVFEDTNKKIEVNKRSLASQSRFFDQLFFGYFKEKHMNEITIGDVNYEEFLNLMDLIYGCDDNTALNCNNVEHILQLAVCRFELKFVEDKVISFLLSSSCSFSLPKKLLISDLYNLPFLKDGIFYQIKSITQLKELSESPEWNQLSKETIRIIFKKFCV